MTENGLRVLDAEPIGQDIIELLEEALQEAKAGQISSIGLAIVFRDGSAEPRWSDAPNKGTLAGAVSRLLWALNEALEK